MPIIPFLFWQVSERAKGADLGCSGNRKNYKRRNLGQARSNDHFLVTHEPAYLCCVRGSVRWGSFRSLEVLEVLAVSRY